MCKFSFSFIRTIAHDSTPFRVLLPVTAALNCEIESLIASTTRFALAARRPRSSTVSTARGNGFVLPAIPGGASVFGPLLPRFYETYHRKGVDLQP